MVIKILNAMGLKKKKKSIVHSYSKAVIQPNNVDGPNTFTGLHNYMPCPAHSARAFPVCDRSPVQPLGRKATTE